MNLREILTGIYDNNAALTPPLVVNLARDENHPLHDRFEWDDTVAGEAYRRVQAAELIRSVKISYATSPESAPSSVRAFHAVPRPAGNTYVPTEEIAEDPFMRELVMRAAEREWRTLQRKYAHLAEFIDMIRRDVA